MNLIQFGTILTPYLLNRIMEDIGQNLDIGQYGGQPGTGEHMILCLVGRILKLLDDNNNSKAVIGTMIDWSNAFDRQDPTLAVKKFIQLGIPNPSTDQLSSR